MRSANKIFIPQSGFGSQQQTMSPNNQDAEVKNQILQAEIAERDRRIQASVHQIENMKHEIMRSKDKIETLEHTIQGMREDAQVLQSQVNIYKTAIQQKNDMMNQLSLKFDESQSKHRQEINKMHEEKMDLFQKIAQQKESQQEQMNQRDEHEFENLFLKQQVQYLQNQLEQFKDSHLLERKKMSEDIIALKKQIFELNMSHQSHMLKCLGEQEEKQYKDEPTITANKICKQINISQRSYFLCDAYG